MIKKVITILTPVICYNMNKIKPCKCLIVCKYPRPQPIHERIQIFKSGNTRNIENSRSRFI